MEFYFLDLLEILCLVMDPELISGMIFLGEMLLL